ncbi:MAG: transcription-repair coupling factor, partial [Georgenia sp.]
MKLTGLLPLLRTDPAIAAATETAHGPVLPPQVMINAPLGVRAALVTEIVSGDGGRPVVVVTATGREADEAAANLRNYLGYDEVAIFPAWETLPHERLSPRSDTVARRLAVLRRLAHPTPDGGPAGEIRVLVIPVRALLQPVVTGLGDLEPVAVQVGQEV